jgi:hypothetical protein
VGQKGSVQDMITSTILRVGEDEGEKEEEEEEEDLAFRLPCGMGWCPETVPVVRYFSYSYY